MFSLIAAIGKNNELGKNGQLVFHLKKDMQFFRETTTGHPVVMGSRTWFSLPAKLKNRTNIVVSSREIEGADEVINDLPAFIKKYEGTDEEIFVIGGGTIYKQFLPHAKNLYLTEIDNAIEGADTFFPDFDHTKYHHKIIKKGTENGIKFAVIKYTIK